MCHGAATIVNAIATGKGAAFGLGLRTWADVETLPNGGIEVEIEGFEGEDPTLVRMCVQTVLDRFSPEEDLGAAVRTRSEIPVSRGLKSSSAAANAAIAATLDALGADCEPLDAIRIGTRCAIEAGVSVTGAFDDAYASYFGGVVVTDNERERVMRTGQMPDGLRAVIHVPPFQIRKGSLPLDRIRSLRDIVSIAWECAKEGEYLGAMTLNGLCYSAALDLDQAIALDALRLGARAAGLSGTGPATVMLVDEEKVDEFLAGMDLEGEVIVTDIFNGYSGRERR